MTPDTIDEDEKTRRDKKFTVNIRNPETPVSSLWALDVAARSTKRLTEGGAYSADDFTISKDSKWVGFRGLSPNRYQRGITSENIYSDLYLLDAATGSIQRLTSNAEISESGLSSSPTARRSRSRDRTISRPRNERAARLLPRHRGQGQTFPQLGDSFDGDVSIGFWSKDGSTIYFNEGIKATNQIVSLDIVTTRCGRSLKKGQRVD